MLKPYRTASLSPPPFFRKKLTVIGIIGHTQGVKIANNPPKRPNKNIRRRSATPDRPLSLTDRSADRSSFGLTDSYSQISGAVHMTSLQALKRIGARSVLATVMEKESLNSWVNINSPISRIDMCHPGSTTARSRTLSPTSSPLHFTGCTNCANSGLKTATLKDKRQKTNIVTIRFIWLLCIFRVNYVPSRPNPGHNRSQTPW